MRWAGNMANMGDRRGAYRVFVGRSKGKNHLENLGIDEGIILKWILKKWDWEVWTALIWLRTETGGGRLLMR
jgi:hypothetical protein